MQYYKLQIQQYRNIDFVLKIVCNENYKFWLNVGGLVRPAPPCVVQVKHNVISLPCVKLSIRNLT